jgi:hypothetical protein
MKPNSVAAAAALLALALGGCTVQGRAYQPEPVPPSVSMIHIYRPYHYYGSLVVPRVTCAQQSVSLKPGGYYSYYTNAGPVTCGASTEVTSQIKFDAKPGEQYFVREEIVPGNIVGRVHLTLVDPDTAREEIAKCREQQPAPDSDAPH